MKSSNIPTDGKYRAEDCTGAAQVVFSSRAYAALLSEVLDEIETETGGVFLGYWNHGVWHVVESIDPGPESRFEVAYFEYDRNYINHLINKVSKIYGRQLDLIGLWHRHPGSFDRFSSTDDETNSAFAALSVHGSLSALVNIDPTFRLTVYRVNESPLYYEKIRYRVLESEHDLAQAPYADAETLMQRIANNGRPHTSSQERPEDVSATCIRKALDGFIAGRAMSKMANEHVSPTDTWSDEDFVLVVAAIESDARELEKIGIELIMQPDENGRLALSCTDKQGEAAQLMDAFGPKANGEILFEIDGQSYLYRPGIIHSAYKEALR